MILGDVCTRRCHYCAVTTGRPLGLDLREPARLAETVRTMGLSYCVITSVNRDDLEDGGAGVFAACIRRIRELVPECRVEVLIPDFAGDWGALGRVLAAGPAVLNHNIESAARVFRRVRPKGGLRVVAGAAGEGEGNFAGDGYEVGDHCGDGGNLGGIAGDDGGFAGGGVRFADYRAVFAAVGEAYRH